MAAERGGGYRATGAGSAGQAGRGVAGGGSETSDVAPAGALGRAGGPRPSDSDRVEVLVEELASLLGDEAALAELDAEALRRRVAVVRRLEGVATAAMASTVRALAQAGGVADDGASSTTAWVAGATGRSRKEASRMTRLGASLPDMPATARALVDGRITGESADAVVGAVVDGRLGEPDQVEATLVPIAEAHGPEAVRGEVRRWAQQVDGAAMVGDQNRQRTRRRVGLSRRDDGMWDLYGRLTGEVGEKARTLLDIFDVADSPETPAECRRRPEQRLADALEAAVDVALGLGDLPASGGQSRPHIAVVVDAGTVAADLTDPDAPDRPVAPDDPIWASRSGVQTAWAGTLAPQTARMLCCDAALSRVVMADSQILDVGRETRVWSGPQRRAIHVRDRACRGPGCGRPIGWTHIHHLRWWRHGGRTDLDNGLALCSACHDLIHHRGWHAELDPATAAVTWTSPDRRTTVVTHPRPPD